MEGHVLLPFLYCGTTHSGPGPSTFISNLKNVSDTIGQSDWTVLQLRFLCPSDSERHRIVLSWQKGLGRTEVKLSQSRKNKGCSFLLRSFFGCVCVLVALRRKWI